MKRLLFILLFPLLTSTLHAATVTDALGRLLTIDQPAQRIVSLVPAVTETLFALGVEEHIVATTDFCDYPPAAQSLPKLGSYSDPSLENILLHRPDLVIASADATPQALVRRLELLNIKVFVVSSKGLSTTMTAIESIGVLCGATVEANQLVAEMQQRINSIDQRASTAKKPTVLVCIMLDPLTVAGPDTFIDNLIQHAGGINIVPAGPSRYPSWGSEALLSLNPDVIIVSSHPGQSLAEHMFERWPQLKAVQHQQIYLIDGNLLHRPGPRILLGLEAMSKALHPELFRDE